MADSTPQRLGFDLQTSDGSWSQDNALFQQIYLTEVYGAFLQANVMADKVRSRTITSGKSASFPRTWKTDAQYHVAGEELTGNNALSQTEKIVKIDGRLASDTFLDSLDEMKLHYDIRSEVAR